MSDEIVLDSQGNPIPHPTDSDSETFYKWLETATLGDTSNIHNLLCQCFNQMKAAKDDLVLALRQGSFDADKQEEATKNLQSMYPMLQRIEERVFKCRDRMKVLQATPLNLPPS